ncbi:MAG TPA: aminotransferase class V-fold PLP-dependent enzyme [Sandaracinaceae bacterium LLY-WYZ-13_1]|nr:aminotransferase class V-fold PLP-dependent enzyme [Sandaracinaceae bacterium LLY-WYZ-13_1]
MREHWLLDPDVVFLNHGSFGACPKPVLAHQTALREAMEREPVQFFVHELEGRLDEARRAVAAFVGARPEDVGFVRNATSGFNAVLRSLALSPGDELLTTDHGYHACHNALDFVARRSGAKVVVARLPFVGLTEDAAVARIVDAVTERTRLAVIDHVTSPTGVVLPIARIVRELNARGVDTLVDGAHAPGMVELDLTALNAAYYTANFHKWTCAPKGAAMLWVREDRQGGLHPAVISHGYDSPRPRKRFLEEIDWTGTDDPTPALCVPEALRFVGSLLDGGWPAVRAHNRALALRARRVLAEALGEAPPVPDAMVGSLAALPIPDGTPEPPTTALYADPLQKRLFARHRIEVPIPPWPAPPKRLIRVSAHLYDHEDEYRQLAEALRAELG